MPDLRALLHPGLPSWRGQMHCHSNRSDGTAPVAEVIQAYQGAGYDWLVLSDHFEAEYDWQITDTRNFTTDTFTAIIGIEMSSGPWDDDCMWVNAAGLPLHFRPPASSSASDMVDAIRRAHGAGAFLVMDHPRLNSKSVEQILAHPATELIHAVEVHNTNMTVAYPDRADGLYALDGLLESGKHVLANAGDDAHWTHSYDRFGGWMEVRTETNSEAELLKALKAGSYYSTQGPIIHEMTLDKDHLHLRTSNARSIHLSGGTGDAWLSNQTALGDPTLSHATFDISPFRGTFCRVTVVGEDGTRAWANPLWP